MQKINHNEDPCIKEFGISVNDEFVDIPARVLDPPQINYANNEGVKVFKGVWRPGKSFERPANLLNANESWTVVNFTNISANEINRFESMFMQEG